MNRLTNGRRREGTEAGGAEVRPYRWIVRASVLAVTILLLYWAFHDVAIPAILDAAGRLSMPQLLLIVSLNIVFHLFLGLRWWLVTHTEVPQAGFLKMAAIRLAGFALSYFTPGPQLGGEPLQVLYLRRCGASLARATATVLMDKLLEIMTNFVFLVLGGFLILRAELPAAVAAISPVAIAGIGVLLLWPLVHVLLLTSGRHPVSAALQGVSNVRWLRPSIRTVRAAENLAGRFCRRKPRELLGGIGLSLLAGAVVVMEYGLIASFFGMGLSVRQSVAAWTAGWLSFVVPVPGALGALEASQVLVLEDFGVRPALALALVLVLRGRDVAFSVIGLAIAARLVGWASRTERQRRTDPGAPSI